MPEVLPTSKVFLEAIAQAAIVPAGQGWLLTLMLKREFPHLTSFKGVRIRLWGDDAPVSDPGINAILRFTVNDGNQITGVILPRPEEPLPMPINQGSCHTPFSRLALTIGEETREFSNDTSQAAFARRVPGEENS